MARCGADSSADRTTTVPRAGELAAFLGGFVAAEGTFLAAPRRYAFAVSLGQKDARTCDLLHVFMGVGNVYRRDRRKPHFDDEVTFRVQALADLADVVVPFMDEHLPPSYKRQQYERWRAELLEYWEHGAKRRRTCTSPGCDEPRRAKGLCRRHYYEAFGR